MEDTRNVVLAGEVALYLLPFLEVRWVLAPQLHIRELPGLFPHICVLIPLGLFLDKLQPLIHRHKLPPELGGLRFLSHHLPGGLRGLLALGALRFLSRHHLPDSLRGLL